MAPHYCFPLSLSLPTGILMKASKYRVVQKSNLPPTYQQNCIIASQTGKIFHKI